jgi:HEPN domain-containing protein
LDRLRRRRNQAEYPDPKGYDPITAAEAKEAIEAAVKCISSVERLLQLDELGVF